VKSHFRHYASLLLGKSPSDKATDGPNRLMNELVPMPEAALLAYISAYGIDSTITRIHRNDMAEVLVRLLEIYAVSDDGKAVRRVELQELEGGIFSDGGRIVRFRDDREAISNLAVTRGALKAAVAALKDTKKPGGFPRAA
jgi:hypothetical protein